MDKGSGISVFGYPVGYPGYWVCMVLPSQPVLRYTSEGVPVNSMSVALKCEKLGLLYPAACTTFIWPLLYMFCMAAIAGCKPVCGTLFKESTLFSGIRILL